MNSFDKIKVNMSKDDVLELVGNPSRTERFEGKEKWAYRFYTEDDHDQWDHRQVTFIDGKVVSVGEDTAEENRLKAINTEDKAREERRKNFKLAPASADPQALLPQGTVDANPQSSIPDPVVPKESDFIEMKGRRGPVNDDTSNK